MDIFHLIVVYFISLSIIGIEGYKRSAPSTSSGSSTAPKRQDTGASSSTVTLAKTEAELFRIMDNNRDNRISAANYLAVSRSKLYSDYPGVKAKLDSIFVDGNGYFNPHGKSTFRSFGSFPVELTKMNKENPYSKQDIIDNFGIQESAAQKIMETSKSSPNPASITAEELAGFFQGDEKFEY